MKSRRRIAFSKATAPNDDYSSDCPTTNWGSAVSLHGSNPESLMSALGQERTFRHVRSMSALLPKADIRQARHVCYVPEADIRYCNSGDDLEADIFSLGTAAASVALGTDAASNEC